MKERWPILLRMSSVTVLAIVLLPLLVWGQLAITTNGDSTRMAFPPSAQLTARLLNFSPAHKILLKVEGSPEAVQAFTRNLAQSNIPNNSGIREVRTIPIGQKAFLLVVDFWERLPFTFQESAQPLQMAVADAPYRDQLENWYRRGLYYHKRGELKKALAYYRKIVFQNRQHGNAYFMAGQIRLQWQQYRLAEINFNRALQGQTDSVRVYYFMAQLYQQTQRPDKAREYARLYELKRAEQVVPRPSPVRQKPAVSAVKLASQQVPDSSRTAIALEDSAAAAENTPIAAASVATSNLWRTRYSVMFLVIGLLGVATVFLGYRWRQQRRVAQKLLTSDESDEKAMGSVPAAATEETIEQKKEKILALFEDVVKTEAQEPVAATAPAIAEKEANGKFSREASPTVMETVETSEARAQDPTELARQLNLGVGEIELALLMSSHQVQSNRQSDYRKEILRLRAQNKSIAEIARELNIGRSEVEIVLKLMNLNP